ncbi:MAG: SDR family oxidoreductase, partial [Anaerolineales bacterium]|nr:SDR family oxidoreductase [Anaerolineales bacterium]
MRLKDKVAVIAGGGLGIGRSVALVFAKEGARSVIADLNREAGEDTVEQIRAIGGEAYFVHTDVSDAAQVQKLISVALKHFQTIDVLFTSVGIYARAKLADTEEEVWDQMMRVNVKSSYLLCKAIIPIMKKAGRGSIILSSSSVGWHDSAPNIAAYATSKFAITGMTKSAACDYLHDNIRVNCICPGPTDTPMIRGGRSPEELTAFINSIPIKRLADPEEIAQTVLFLAS